MSALNSIENNLLKIGSNCWRADTATHAAMLIDCANYYRALHSAICKAEHSIFVLGWDIDSRIELLRGEEAKHSECPSIFFDLIQWKARQNPDLVVYLNRWEFSMFFATQREGLSTIKWRMFSPANVHYSFDALLPVSACHHQKVIIIDDEIAFCGGMDVAIARWDHREHHPDDNLREDPGGMQHLIRKIPFGPYHDVQCVVAGPAAQSLAKWCRERWRRVAGFEPVPLRPLDYQNLPRSWPRNVAPDFYNVQVGIAMTLPPTYGEKAIQEVEHLYLDMIAAAENFIYIENQYLTSVPIAKALNQQLRKKPNLRVLISSCFESNGIIERKSMWTGRIKFREIVESGDVSSRVAIAYPVSCKNGREKDVRIHSKIMIVDDLYLRVGSSNINNRSMGLDTECDLVFIGNDETSRHKIASIRNDLISEHTGRDMDSIEKLVSRETDIGTFLNYIGTSNQHLRRVNDEHFRFEKLAGICTFLGDPIKPLIPAEWTMTYCYAGTRRNLPRRLIFVSLVMAFFIALAGLSHTASLSPYLSPEILKPLLTDIRLSHWGIAATLGAFIIGGIFLPVTVLITATAIIWGPVMGLYLSLIGTLASAILGFATGRLLGLRILHIIMGSTAEKLNQFVKDNGMAGMTFLRMIPAAPFSITSLGLGVSDISFIQYFGGTFMGMLPRILVLVILGDALMQFWQNPDTEAAFYLAFSIAGWFGLLIWSHFLVRHWQENYFPQGYIHDPSATPLF
ncbi:MAG: VTT domain-containing protein [Micavibrio sp.]